MVHETERPLSRQSTADLAVRASAALGRSVSRSTVGRVLRAAALKPWRYDHWIFPRDPRFADRAAVVLDLYAGSWQGAPLTRSYKKAVLVHTPVHASWLNQVEIYFANVQRKILTPNDFADLAEVELRLRLYEELCNRSPSPFAWEFTTDKLHDFLRRLAEKTGLEPGTYL